MEPGIGYAVKNPLPRSVTVRSQVPEPMIAYQADWICTATAPPIRNGFLVVEGNRIATCGPGAYPREPIA